MEVRWQLATLVLSAVLSWVSGGWGEYKESLTAGVILPKSAFFRRRYSSAIMTAIRGFKDIFPSSKLRDKYELRGVVLHADKYSPPELLNFFCEEILANKMNVVIYMSNSDYEGQHTSAGQFVLQVSNYLGIPVIAWNADNSGFFQVS